MLSRLIWFSDCISRLISLYIHISRLMQSENDISIYISVDLCNQKTTLQSFGNNDLHIPVLYWSSEWLSLSHQKRNISVTNDHRYVPFVVIIIRSFWMRKGPQVLVDRTQHPPFLHLTSLFHFSPFISMAYKLKKNVW
jgi:hypothetical protein